MTIDEAIEKYNKLANNDRTCYPEEAQQLAEWLEELKKLRQCTNIENREYPYFNGFKEGKQVGYNKAIDDFLERIQWEYLNSCGIEQKEIEFLIAVSSQVAEQLKAGASNGNL